MDTYEDQNEKKLDTESLAKAHLRELRNQALKEFKAKYPNGVKMLTEDADFLT